MKRVSVVVIFTLLWELCLKHCSLEDSVTKTHVFIRLQPSEAECWVGQSTSGPSLFSTWILQFSLKSFLCRSVWAHCSFNRLAHIHVPPVIPPPF